MASNTMNSLFHLTTKPWIPLIQPVRFRYYKDQQGKGPVIRRYGYKDKFFPRGLLARAADEKRLTEMLVYTPKDVWSEERALFGQNDYIDILGDNNLHPTKILYNLPKWVRGMSGNEYQMLLYKRKMLQHGNFPYEKPKKWREMNTRIDWLYKYLNKHQKAGMPEE